MKDKHIPLTQTQIQQLEKQNCKCTNWNDVLVSPAFKTDNIKTVTFSGKIKLGAFDKQVSFYGGVLKPAGLRDAHIHNCVIGDNVYISNVLSHIANYIIEDECIIEHIDLLATEGQTTFGNGVKAVVINEGGGREILIYDNLCAQVAYMMALYRHKTKVLENLEKMIMQYADSVKSDIGTISKGAHLTNCGTIKNVRIGQFAVIGNVKRLENGTIKSCKEDPTEVGASVVAKDFIIAEGAKISESSIISDCFIGQAVRMTKQFSAENSVCFANCGFHHGEICSIFAGPYTVSHHKSTLLIAGLFSFFNAGSGTNQSNHMYKVGSVHQGIFERGAKMASDGYVMYPVRIGAFCVVMGRHYQHPDTGDMPFSYIYEQDNKCFVVPAVNLRTVGIIRDGEKWPKRDERKCPNKTDLIIFDVLSPYTVQKIINGLETLLNLKAVTGGNDVQCSMNLHLKAAWIHKGIELYTLAINKFLGDCLVAKLADAKLNSIDDLQKIFKQSDSGLGKWVDVAGLLAPQSDIESLLNDIESGALTSMNDIQQRLQKSFADYKDNKWSWVCEKLNCILKNKIDAEGVIKILNVWQQASHKLYEMIAQDAQKEFETPPRIGYGIDGDEKVRDADFDAVRGIFESNGFVKELKKRQANVSSTAQEWIEKIKVLT
jgi:NDP-sugar pyrophosphorylase family protein